MRRVIQRTVRTTTIVSLTITHSESEEAVEYTLIDAADQADRPTPSALDETAPDRPLPDHDEADLTTLEPPAPSASGPDTPEKA